MKSLNYRQIVLAITSYSVQWNCEFIC